MPILCFTLAPVTRAMVCEGKLEILCEEKIQVVLVKYYAFGWVIQGHSIKVNVGVINFDNVSCIDQWIRTK